MANKLKCWKKESGLAGTYINKKKGLKGINRLNASLSKQVCIIDNAKNSKCILVKDNDTPNKTLINFLKKHDTC